MRNTKSKSGRISPRMMEVLRFAAAGKPVDTGVSGRSEYGGLTGTLASLRRRGLLDLTNQITDEGRAIAAPATSAKGESN